MEFALARVIHVLAVVLWIGGVAMVTTVLLPAVKRLKVPEERVEFFEKLEARFAWQSRITTLLAGLSGFYMLHVIGWERLTLPGYWWLHAMIGVWLLFTLMLFVFEPLFLHRWFHQRAIKAPEATFRLIQTMHWILLGISLITIAGAVAGSHGWLWF
ncbi:hypothetical protein [Pistricoccus aurantiacus]|uniref:hypothetical protein n=1 Tax=Pistricoccus aurantiacus TaxID=1883414 RepID=UPI0036402930